MALLLQGAAPTAPVPIGHWPVPDKWGRMAARLCGEAQRGAQTYMVLRARRIWGRLGGLLKRSLRAFESDARERNKTLAIGQMLSR